MDPGGLVDLSTQTYQIAPPEKKPQPSSAGGFPRIWYTSALGKIIGFWIDTVPCLVHQGNEYCIA